MTDLVKELAERVFREISDICAGHMVMNPTEDLLQGLVRRALEEAERAGREGMREETIKELRTGNYCQRIDHIQDACQCDGMELAIRALPVPPPKPERGSR